MVYTLQDGILYGPVNSRRFGKSLGINLMPCREKLCSFDCLYCHYGWTVHHTLDVSQAADGLPTIDEVAGAIEGTLRSDEEFEYITFSGNGESTLHPDFPEIVMQVAELRDRFRPKAMLALLSNSTGLYRESVRKAIAAIDIPVLKLDSGSREKFEAINCPADGVDFEKLLELLVAMENIYVQTLLVGGEPSNSEPEDIEAYCRCLKAIQPLEAHIYSIDRPVPDSGLKLVGAARLEEIAQEIRRVTGVTVRTFSAS